MTAEAPLVSVVVPVLDEQRTLPAVLDHLATLAGHFETIVVDGGSADRSAQIARGHHTRPVVLTAGGGRARQLNAGAHAARGELIVFLHADSRLPAAAHPLLADAWRAGAAGGNFALRFEGGDRFARTLTRVYRFQRRRGFYYGDSTIWVRREVFRRLGGYRALPIMDDYDFARRLERHGGTRCLPGPATTSARRWRRMGIARTVTTWNAIRWLYLAGVPPERLARLYRPVR